MIPWALFAWLAGASAQQTELELGTLSALSLPDQYGAEDCLRAHEGRPTVVFIVSAERLRSLRSWEKALRERFGDQVDYLRIADVVTDAPTTHERVAEKLKERVPPGVAILVDLERQWAAELGLATDEPNLLVVAPSGELVAHYRGRPDAVLEELVARQIQRVLGTT